MRVTMFKISRQFDIILEELAGQLRSAIQKDDRCPTDP
jgi:hypothetical protein